MLPTLRQLEYLRLLAEHGSFHRAAEAAGIGQPALSSAIQELERILGGPVVERIRNDVQLTPSGRAACRGGDDVLTRTKDLVEAVRQSGRRPLAGPLRLGVIPTVAPFLLPAAATRLRNAYPELQLFLREAATDRLTVELRAGKLDCAIIALPYDIGAFERASIGYDEFVAAAPSDHAFVGLNAIPVEALRSDELILLERGHCLRDQVLAALGGDFDPGSAGFAASSLHTLAYMIASGSGVSAIPALAVGGGITQGAGLVLRGFATPAPRREIVLVWRCGWPRALDARLLAGVLKGVTMSLVASGTVSSDPELPGD